MNLLLALSLSPNYEKKKNTMSTLLNRLTLLVSFAFSALCLQAADKKPFGLMTDLIEHTGQTWQNDTILLALLFAAELGEDRRILYAGEEFALAEKTIGVESAAAVIGELAAHGADTENGTLTLNFDDASVRVTAEDEHTVKLSAQAKTPRDAEDALRYAEKGIMESVHGV